MTLKLISWNVNGLRACIQKGFLDQFQKLDADFFCLQETKLQEGQLTLDLPGYEQYWCYAEKKGYSGTAIFTKHTPISVSYGIGVPELDNEGRVITLEYPEFYLVNCYTPNAQRGLARLAHRMKWDEAYRAYISSLDEEKPTILCGDLNVAHKEIDLKNPASNRGNAGFSDEERESFSKTLSLGFTDTFRYLNPTTTGAYSWWSYMYHARENNAGWRIDYFLVSDRLRDQVYSAPIYSNILGSDHCPVGLELDISCNGSIWMEACQGQPEVIQIQDKPKLIASKVIVSALALLLFGLGAVGIFGFPKSYEKYVKLHIYEQPLRSTIYYNETKDIFATAFTDGTEIWPLNNSGYLSSIYSHIDPTDDVNLFPTPSISYYPVTSRMSNFWLRLDLTDQAKEAFDPSWKLSAALESSTDETTPIWIRSYFEKDDASRLMGWFLCGNIPGESIITITLDTGDEVIDFQVAVQPVYTGETTSSQLDIILEEDRADRPEQ